MRKQCIYSRLVIGVLVAMFYSITVHAEQSLSQRIVSVGGGVTEIIYALGEQSRIIGVDTTSTWPREAATFPQVGYQRSLSAEGILSLKPDLVIGTSDIGPPEVLEQLRGVGLAVTIVNNEPTEQGVAQKIRGVAEALDKGAEGEILVAEMAQQMRSIRQQLRHVVHKPRVLFLFNTGRGAPLVSGVDTSPDGMIELSGGENAVSSFSGFKPLNAEAMISIAPDIVLTTERTLKMAGGVEGMRKIPGLQQTPAGKSGKIIAMDTLYLLGLGPRTPQAVATLAHHLHPAHVSLNE